MTGPCKICLRDVKEGDYHPRCLRALFGSGKAPRLPIKLAKVHTAALAMLGHTSLSGVQKKISVNLSTDRETLQVAIEGGRYILKPQTEAFPSLPENEQVTTRMAQLVDIEVAPFGLVSLEDDTLAYVVRRFDRRENGSKVRQEDFCQLAEQSPKEKYVGSAERCVQLIRRYASEPLIEILKFYRLLVFAWWSGNGDMHLKNFSVLADEQGLIRLTPAYDLVSSMLVIPNDEMALPMGGRQDRLNRRTWLRFAEFCQLSERAAIRVLDKQVSVCDRAIALIDRSFLPSDQKDHYRQIVEERSAILAG